MTKSPSRCYVTADDYQKYWGTPTDPTAPPPYDGADRRSGVDRREHKHDRRWNNEVGRRWQCRDRRKRVRTN